MNKYLRETRISVSAIAIVISLSCMACGNNQANTGHSSTIDTANIITDTTSKEAVYTDDDNDDIQFIPKDIKRLGTGPAKIIPGKNFDPALALRVLFPGNYYRYSRYGDSASIEELVSWRCKECPAAGLKGWDDEAPNTFPSPEGDMTLVTDTLLYTGDDGQQNVLVAFSTMPVQSREFMYTGRFSCAVLGLALFTRSNGQWSLNSFAPALGCYGAFQSMPKMHLLKLGTGNYGCYLLNTNGGAGGPFYSDVYVFGMVNGTFKKIMEDNGVQRLNAGESEWHATLKNTPQPAGAFNNIALSMTGIYSKALFTANDTISNLPKELMNYVASKDSLNFTITREYQFKDGAYRATTTKTEVK